MRAQRLRNERLDQYEYVWVPGSYACLNFLGSPFLDRFFPHPEGETCLVLAPRTNRLIAAYSYYMARRGVYQSHGVFVARGHRRQGLGQRLWLSGLQRASTKQQIRRVDVVLATHRGRTLVESVRRAWAISPTVATGGVPDWVLVDYDDRKPTRVLKKARG